MSPSQQPPAPALTGRDYEAIARCLDDAIAIFERSSGALNAIELRSKSILGAIRSELRERIPESGPPRG